MEHAWLEELSEDWPSDPICEGSPPPPSLPSLSNSTSSQRPPITKIPKFNPQKQAWAAPLEGDSSALGERSLSENNIPLSQRSVRQPSKLKDVANDNPSRRTSRALSTSTTASTQCHTVQHKSHSISPQKSTREAPEWKRRLLHGEVAYGEQCDLFSPAGLENMFRPPPSQTSSPVKGLSRNRKDSSVALPSSPPPYHFQQQSLPEENSAEGNSIKGSGNGQTEERKPKGMRYIMTEPAGSDFTADDLSRSSTFRPAAASLGRAPPSDGPSMPDSSLLDIKDARNRTISGQSDTRNEELSPIFMTRQNPAKQKGDPTPLAAEELKRRLKDIREDDPVQSIEDEMESSAFLPTNTTQETDDYAHNGNFINLRRGGYSQEGSFQQRMLSPSSLPAIDESAMLPEHSMQASTPKQLPVIRKTRVSNEYHEPAVAKDSMLDPQTPRTSPRKPTGKEQNSSSGSPLKLFGAYDTFTNQKLLRRLSQFEGVVEDQSGNGVTSNSRTEPTNSELNNAFVAASSPDKKQGKGRTYQSFGEGDLDSFRFSESYGSSESEVFDDDKESISLPRLNPRDHSSFRFQLEPSPALEDNAIARRRNSTTTQGMSSRKSTRPRTTSSSNPEMPASQRQEDLQTPRKRTGDSEGKRLPKTPLKDPTPKRRRTLHRSDDEYEEIRHEETELELLKETHQQMQSVIGRKRKDARHGDDQQAAHATVLAMRQILRPRTPTPSQRSSILSESGPPQEKQLSSDDRLRLLQQKKIAQIQAELDSTDPLRVSGTLGMAQQMLNDSRKGSVTTQDFLDEARKIMAGIRGKARSGLTSLEESENENDRNQSAEIEIQDDDIEDSYQESTIERFSRPPSREGKPLTRLPLVQDDPALLDHLRKYQEMSEADGVVASSIRSMAMAKEALLAARELDKSIEDTISRKETKSIMDSTIASDPPNTQISENPDVVRKRKHSTSSIPTDDNSIEADFQTQGSLSSSGQSTVQSIPTGSSRGSDSRRVIAPHTVSHLIPEQLAGMVFDRESNRWVKRRSSGEGQNFLPSDESEEDPFGDIPDLSVDETQEMQRIKAVAAKRIEEARVAQLNVEWGNSERSYHGQPRRLSADIPEIIIDSSPASEPSRGSQFTHSGPPSESGTKSTSWAESDAPKAKSTAPAESIRSRTITHATTEEFIEEVEREISIHEDRVTHTPQRKRKVTIMFSSPLESIIQNPEYDDASFQSEAQVDNESDSAEEASNSSVIVTKKSGNSTSSSSRTRSALRTTSRRVSVAGHSFAGRPVSRIEERDEESFNEGSEEQHRRSVSIIVTTPAIARRVDSLMLATPRPTHEIGTLTLTPMSDFTMHQADDTMGLDVSYVAQNQRYVMGGDNRKTLSLSIKTLVEKITEVEPYEPFWDNMKELELRDKKLSNLHKLDEFCGEIEELDVSHNQLTQLDGVPRTVRQLRITHNVLSDLTAWCHLQNLQYVDVSNNELDSLSAFKSLVHMRSLRADNNKIKSLKGVDRLDGLLSLRLRGNSVQTLDFSGTGLQRLTDLDLKDNHVSKVAHLGELRSLSSLNLVDNHLCDFSVEDSEVLWTLKYLKLSGNNLESIDVSRFPNLRLLYLDQNRLGKVTGLLKTKHLDSLSMREQHEDCLIDQSFLDEAFEVRKLFLSGNRLGTFQPTTDFLNLQYLELANCGLESLPEGFGYLVANTRVLNLNYNALSDLSPLEGIVRLKKLHLAGNRLRLLKETAQGLSLVPTLALADLRGNPLTVGFYPPVLETAMVLHDDAEAEPRMSEPYTLVEADPAKVTKYGNCLDLQTKMLKRTYEMLVITTCRRLLVLDGLTIDRAAIKTKDGVWEELVRIGVFNAKAFKEEPGEKGQGAAGQSVTEKPTEEERWQAEDSFA